MNRRGARPGSALRAAIVLLLAAALLATAVPAFAWGGGATSYGTHDWIVDQAARVLDGRAADWFDVGIAREASDDPDSVENHGDPLINEHTYREKGRRGGGPARAAHEYDLAQAAYRLGVQARDAGDGATADAAFADASHHLGLLSHFVGDLAQPFHTAYDAIDRDRLHRDYEALVNQTRWPDASPAWQPTRRSVSAIDDILRTMVDVAAYSRSFWPELRHRLTADGVRMTSRVSEITGAVLRRAATTFADIVWSVEQGVGAQPDIGRLAVSVRWTGVRAGGTNAVFVRAYDIEGNPIEGLRVDVQWPTPTGTCTAYLYTDPHGYQQRWDTVGRTPRLVRRPVVATATVRGVTTRVERSWTISPVLDTGRAGFRTTVSDATVGPDQAVTVTGLARNRSGVGVPNLLVTFTWDDGASRVRTTAWTDASGRATTTRTLPEGAGTVTVTARTQAGSVDRSASVTFRRVP